jgi:hypothetical protein
VPKGTISAFKRVEFVSDWRDIIIVNCHAPTGNKIDSVRGSFCKELATISTNSLNTL